MYRFRGHTFDGATVCSCCVGDVKLARRDPTGTMSLQRKFNTTYQLAWRSTKRAVIKMLVERDLLSLQSGGLFQVVQPAITAGGSKVLAFQRWFDYLLASLISESHGERARPFLQQAYAMGVAFAHQEAEAQAINVGVINHRLEALQTLAYVELQGICEAVSQQAVRAVTHGLLYGFKPKEIARNINKVIDAIGSVRTAAMVSVMTVKAFNEASLDTYEAAGIKQVSTVPETVPVTSIGDAKRTKLRMRRTTGPGSRVSRKSTPSKSTIQRIKKAEAKLEKLGLVNVLTAGDNKVCQICEDISEDGPYPINTARQLIPAHPKCRCAFVPVKDKRFAKRERSDGALNVLVS